VQIWLQYVVGPTVVAIVGFLLTRQFRKVRDENAEQHSVGQQKIDLLIDSHHNLSGKVDGLVGKLENHLVVDHSTKTRKKAS
jgi:hypothetical protein